jgi:ribosome recycling factor
MAIIGFEGLSLPVKTLVQARRLHVIQEVIREAEAKMRASLKALEEDLGAVRTGRATPALVEKLMVEYYGADTALNQLASISVPEARQLLVKPFDPSTLGDIEKAIITSDLGINPSNDGKQIFLNLPPLTEERRRDLVKMVSTRLEEARVSVRNIRRDAIKDMREYEEEKMVSEDDLKRGEDDMQKTTDKYVEEINAIGDRKEKEVMEV